MKTLIFGCGYLGARVARLWHEAGHGVAVVTRDKGRASRFRANGWQTIVADVTNRETLDDLPAVDTVLFAVGHDKSGGPSIEEVYAGGVGNILAALPDSTGA